MNIQILINLLFSPLLWITKKIVSCIQQKALLEHQAQEAEKQRIHDAEQKEKDRELEKFKEEEKTKRLAMTLDSEREITEIKYKNDHPNPIDELIFIRKIKRGKKTK